MQLHIDYIHYNPLKHEFVEHVEDWSWSTYHGYIKEIIIFYLPGPEKAGQVKDKRETTLNIDLNQKSLCEDRVD